MMCLVSCVYLSGLLVKVNFMTSCFDVKMAVRSDSATVTGETRMYMYIIAQLLVNIESEILKS